MKAKSNIQPPINIISRRKQLVTLILLLLGALVLFSVILLTSQKYADGDEAVVGIMAKHILTKGEWPVFYYGQVYGGGGAIEAYLTAIPFAIFGPSAIALKSVALCLWLVTIALCYLFCLRRYDYATAIFSSIILITATALIEWHLKMRGGYAEIPVFFMGILICFNRLIEKDPNQKSWQFVLLGLLCGAAYYNLEIIIPFLLTLLLFSLFWRSIFWQWKPILLTGAGFLLGTSLLIIYNFSHNFINFKYIFGRGAGNGTNLFLNLFNLLTVQFPRFFVGSNIGDYISNPPLLAYLEYAIYFVLFVFLTIKTWPHATKRIGSLFSRATASQIDVAADMDTFLIGYLIICPLIFSVSGNIGSPETGLRYLFPLYPALAIVAARAVYWLRKDQKRVLNLTGTLSLAALILFGSINHLSYIGQTSIYDDVMLPQGLVHHQTNGESISKLIDFLNQRHASRVWTTYFVQWRLIFESNEQIIASSYNLMPGADIPRYLAYDSMVWQNGGQPQAIILHQEDAQLARVLEQATTEYEQEVIGEYVVLIPK